MFDHHLTQFAGHTVRFYTPEQGITHPDDIYRISTRFDESNWGGNFEKFMADPRVGQAKGVVIGAWMGDTFDTESAFARDALVASAEKLPNIHAIFFGDITCEENEVSWIEQTDLAPILRAYPNLTHFGIRGGNELRFGQTPPPTSNDNDVKGLLKKFFTPNKANQPRRGVSHTKLTSLQVEAGGLDHEVVTDILQSDLPNLTHLELYIGTDEYGRTTEASHLAPLLEGNLFPKLRYLGLRDADNADDIAVAIANAPIVKQIETLDLSLGTLTDHGGQALLDSPTIRQLRKLDLHYHYLSDDMMQKLAALPLAVDVSDQQQSEDDWRYVAVGE